MIAPEPPRELVAWHEAGHAVVAHEITGRSPQALAFVSLHPRPYTHAFVPGGESGLPYYFAGRAAERSRAEDAGQPVREELLPLALADLARIEAGRDPVTGDPDAATAARTAWQASGEDDTSTRRMLELAQLCAEAIVRARRADVNAVAEALLVHGTLVVDELARVDLASMVRAPEDAPLLRDLLS